MGTPSAVHSCPALPLKPTIASTWRSSRKSSNRSWSGPSRSIGSASYVRLGQHQLPPVLAPAPAQVAEHGLAAPGLLAQLLVGKYCDHLPFYRQEQIFWQRHGVFIARQQMVQWTAQSVRLLSGLTDCLKDPLRHSGYLQVDETPVRYQDPDLTGRCGQGYLWVGLVSNYSRLRVMN